MAIDKPKKKRETTEENLYRLTEIERGLWADGLSIAGIDEVGPGPPAGAGGTGCGALPPTCAHPRPLKGDST